MNKLSRLNEFKNLLQNYQPNQNAVELLNKVDLALLVGPSSSGKNTIIHELLKTKKFAPVLSDTTRPPRIIEGELEQDGVVYYFRSEEEIINSIVAGEYLEIELIHDQQVSGLRAAELEPLLSSGKTGINEIDVKGVDTYKQLSENVSAFFVIPPNFTVWMNRMIGRGNMEADEVKRRLLSAENELQRALDTDYYTYIVNDKLQVAVTEIMTVLSGQPVDQEDHKESAWKLLNELKANTSS